ncbi:putative oxidoreductase ucpA [Trichoderma velutinum]
MSQQLSELDEDYFTTLNLFTATYHRDVYDAIDPESPRLSQAGKVIVITGASSGIGKEAMALSFAKAGAKALYLISRSQDGLDKTRELVLSINSNVKVFTKALSITDEDVVQELFLQISSEYGKADVLINCAGIGSGGALLTASVADIWRDFEVNVKGTIIMSQYFAKALGKTDKGHIINIASSLGPFMTPKTDSYALSKLIQIQMQRYITAENPNIFAASLHPGSIRTAMTSPEWVRFSKDTPSLAGGAAVWLSSAEADFMNGRYFDASWDVPELMEKKEDIIQKGLLLMELRGDFMGGRG